ncbi:hypothetical protein [Ramlibacter agri]|uniref:hypothetical protein n=1 Tax=Ramlibacter agri TaxID=2728837 RepID=UPI003CCA0CB7
MLFATALSSAVPSFASRVSPADLAALGICSQAVQEARFGTPGSQPQDESGPLGSDLHHCPLCAPAAHAALAPALFRASIPAADLPFFALPRLDSPEQPGYAGSIWLSRGPPRQA